MKEILARSEAWVSAIDSEYENLLPTGDAETTWKKLKGIFDYGEEFDEELRKRMVKEYALTVAVAKGDIPHLEPTVKDAFLLCEELNKLLPSSLDNEPNLKNLNKSKYHFYERGEHPVFQFVRNITVTMIEVQVRTDVLEEEIVHWAKDKLYVLSFVPELDEEHTISTIYSL